MIWDYFTNHLITLLWIESLTMTGVRCFFLYIEILFVDTYQNNVFILSTLKKKTP